MVYLVAIPPLCAIQEKLDHATIRHPNHLVSEQISPNNASNSVLNLAPKSGKSWAACISAVRQFVRGQTSILDRSKSNLVEGVYYFHLAKTGGTAFTHNVLQWLAKFREHAGKNHSDFAVLSREGNISGIPFETHYAFLVMLRNPIPRALSHYRHDTQTDPSRSADTNSLEDFLQKRCLRIKGTKARGGSWVNRQAVLLGATGVGPEDLCPTPSEVYIKKACTLKGTKAALDSLDKFTLLLITEEYDLSVCLVLWYFHHPKWEDWCSTSKVSLGEGLGGKLNTAREDNGKFQYDRHAIEDYFYVVYGVVLPNGVTE
eukprot:gene17479-20813_t